MALDAILNSHPGDLLDNVEVRDASFEEWLEVERRELQELALLWQVSGTAGGEARFAPGLGAPERVRHGRARADWQAGLERWLAPFLAQLTHPARRAMCPLYVAGLIGPGDRKSVQPMAQRLGLAGHDQLHHFIAVGGGTPPRSRPSSWPQADRLVGGPDACLIVDDTALPKKGTRSVGVAPQYASALGKNGQLPDAGLAHPGSRRGAGAVGLRLFLPESWTSDPERLDRAGVPEERRAFRTKPEIALAEIDRVRGRGRRASAACWPTPAMA